MRPIRLFGELVLLTVSLAGGAVLANDSLTTEHVEISPRGDDTILLSGIYPPAAIDKLAEIALRQMGFSRVLRITVMPAFSFGTVYEIYWNPRARNYVLGDGHSLDTRIALIRRIQLADDSISEIEQAHEAGSASRSFDYPEKVQFHIENLKSNGLRAKAMEFESGVRANMGEYENEFAVNDGIGYTIEVGDALNYQLSVQMGNPGDDLGTMKFLELIDHEMLQPVPHNQRVQGDGSP